MGCKGQIGVGWLKLEKGRVTQVEKFGLYA